MVSTKANSQGRKMPDTPISTAGPKPAKPLTPEAQRALKEAEERRQLADAERAKHPPAKEVGGRKGPDPTRYGDWVKDGIASDF
jgi:hypothetical protein